MMMKHRLQLEAVGAAALFEETRPPNARSAAVLAWAYDIAS